MRQERMERGESGERSSEIGKKRDIERERGE